MRLIPRELDKLTLHLAGSLAQKRLARGLKLNQTEAIALLATVMMELARDGRYSVAELMDIGREILGRRHVMPGVWKTLHELQVESTFKDGTFLITVHNPISTVDGNIERALYGSFLPPPSADVFGELDDKEEEAAWEKGPGAVVSMPGRIVLGEGRRRVALRVTNSGDRPVQVGSHYHFIETNPNLIFDRELSYGMHLDIPAGAALRFEPGDTRIVNLVAIGGRAIIRGGNNLASGPVCPSRLPEIMERIHALGYGHQPQRDRVEAIEPHQIDRASYAQRYGPTTGDLVRLGDTSLWVQVERDYTVYGDECVFGGGKVIRDGMGQCTGIGDAEALDLVLTNALVLDYTGIYKADIGVKNGIIIEIGKAGNPDIMEGVHPNLYIGATTEVIAAEGAIVTAGAIDAHVHFICPQLAEEALSNGITTLIGGGTGPATGTNATTCTPGRRHMELMLAATDDLPLNFGFTGKGNCSDPKALRDQVEAGAIGLKLHEDWGTTPAAIDTCLGVCEEYDVQATIHTDTLNESGFVEHTLNAFKGRTIHTYHTEGAGGGHAPDILVVCGADNVLPSSTNPTMPYAHNTLSEHLDMLMVCHHLSRDLPEDIAFAESRIRAETIAAEDILHDIGAISMLSSDSQAMGRIGEVVARTWRTASKMRDQRGPLLGPGETEADRKADNFRVRRYIAKYTINPAVAHGVAHVIGSVEAGKLADLVVWRPEHFGTKPDLVIKGGFIAWANMGDANASIPTTQPRLLRPMFGARPMAAARTSIAFVSQASLPTVRREYGLRKRVEAVRGCRGLRKSDMKLNDALPAMRVDPETYAVTADGADCECKPAMEVPLAGRVYLF
ncbi:uncharacterized protein VTP21DRAFT_6695 [Calcarisporiella thermophila]|uniref:uncharacterized protein n=1 Tax=Calcarisporiella thermophila TaxID=911321 RepID=UPI0037420A7C